MKGNAIKTNIKAAVFVVLLGASLLLFNYSPLGEYLDPRDLLDRLGGAGPPSPLLFIIAYGVGTTMFLPASLFTGIGALLFGLSWGLLYNMTGAMLGASMSFCLARYLGRDFAAAVAGEQLLGYDEKLKEKGFATTLYLRLVFFPFTPLNFGLGLTSVTFSQFFWGTLFGKIASGFIFTFFFATLAEVWGSGQWLDLLGWKSLLALLLFVNSFFIPKIATRLLPAT